ncbi:hypothetical protein RIR_jg32670.t1 [Rhizophagus irregularis DAOM 181602=DAOM 197198]|nr:hypothetical protein RIR_jg32670.t1 [Rhizophagus irregularis DAOM 181602=DAOM 197198]
MLYNIYFNILTFVTVYYYGSSEKTLFLNIFAAQIFDLRETRGTNIAFLSISCDRFMPLVTKTILLPTSFCLSQVLNQVFVMDALKRSPINEPSEYVIKTANGTRKLSGSLIIIQMYLSCGVQFTV